LTSPREVSLRRSGPGPLWLRESGCGPRTRC